MLVVLIGSNPHIIVNSFSITLIKLSLILIYNLILDPVVVISILDLIYALIKL